VGLIARFLEDKGIPTVAVYLQDEMVRAVPAPRMLHVKWPFGNPYGEPRRPMMQAMVLRRLLDVAAKAEEFGFLDRPDWPWRRTQPDLPSDWTDAVTTFEKV
jgi:hypothetical protein